MSAYYNEFEPYAAQWLRNLISAGHIAPGEVDERSITDVQADDLRGFDQCHFFAGIGGWSYALRLAGFPDDGFVWTGSCPCQPFSNAGKQDGQDDARHLWPVFARLIGECRPVAVFGEQVAGAVGFGWLDGVCADLEAHGYAVGAAVLGAHSVGAPHIRQRLLWVADAISKGRQGCQHKESIPRSSRPAQSVNRDALAIARQALAGDFGALLRDDGVPVSVERRAAKGYGNAIVPQVAAEFISAFMECRP